VSVFRGPDGGWQLAQRVTAGALVALAGLATSGCPDGAGDGRSTGGTGRSSVTASGTRPAASAATPGGASRPVVPGTGATQPGEDDSPQTVDDEPEVDHEGACAPADPGLAPLQLLRFTFADGVEGKDPREKLNIARPGQRVYAHLRLRNRSGRDRCVHVVFRVGGKKRTDVTLKVGESWSWRTWAYNTLRSDDRGPLQVVVTDDQGKVIVQQSLAVVPQ